MTQSTASNWTFLHDGTTNLLIMVFKENTPSGLAWLFNTAVSSGNVGYYFLFGASNQGLGNTVYNASGSTPLSAVSNSVSSVITDDVYHITQVLCDADNATAADRSEIYVDNGSAAKNNTLTNAVSTASPSYSLAVGRQTNLAAGNLQGAIAEIIVLSGAAATNTNRTILLAYLQAKWGL